MEVGNENVEGTEEKNEKKYSTVGFGRALAIAKPGEEVVISGISGSFPSSNNIHEFRENLYNKVNMVQPNRRWDLVHPEIPSRSGTIPEIGRYDPGFFGIHARQADSLDVQISMLHEKIVEAIFDAGMHPSDLQNTRTGLYAGICYSENEKMWFFDKLGSQTYCMTGSERSMVPHRLSYLLKLKGPSHTIDTACSSSLYALEHAFRAIRTGEVDNAIVTGTNLCLHPFVSLQFARLGVLSKDGICKTFDQHGNGYTRSEAIGVLILQKAKDAKRVYAEVVYAKTNCDGFKEQGITFPSKEAQSDLLNDFYDDCGVDRSSLSFLEAHGTGTVVGDPEECFAIDKVFTKNRRKPLLVGSVKSNIGHSEPASGICSIIKCIIGLEIGLIPPNIHYNTPRSEIVAILEGRMRVVTEKTPFEDDRGLIGVNSFGFGGGNCHILLRWNPKTKRSVSSSVKDNLPRLVCLSGRTDQAVVSLLDSVTKNKFDPEYIKLLHDGFRKNVGNHAYRGYTIVSQSGEIARSTNFLKYPDDTPPVCFLFGELRNWDRIGSDLMAISAFSNFVQRVQMVLLKHGVNIVDILLRNTSARDVGLVLGSVVVQMGVIDLFDLVKIRPHTKFGYSVGELLSAYYDGSLSFEETVNYAFSMDKALSNLRETLMSNDNYQESKIVNGNSITNGDALAHNGDSNEDIVQNGKETLPEYLRASLKSKDLVALKESLSQSVLKDTGHAKDGKGMRNFVNALFNDEFAGVPCENSVLLKIGDSPLNESEDVSVISLFKGKSNSFVELLKGLGSLYELGYNPRISYLYPSVELPVSRGTEMISPHIRWNHRNAKYIPQYNVEVASQARHGCRSVTLHTDDNDWTYITGHVIDGRNLFPATGYLYLVWETFSVMKDTMMNVMQVCFENCRFIRATTIPKKGYFTLHVSINRGTGNFEVLEGDSLVVTGRISLLTASEQSKPQCKAPYTRKCMGPKLHSKDVYKELRLRGYSYKGEFRAIEECDTYVTEARIRWNDNWVTFMDNMLQLRILQTDTRLLYVPTTISKLIIKGDVHMELVAAEKLKEQELLALPVTIDSLTNTISCGTISIEGLIASSIPRKKVTGIPVLESYRFVPNVAELSVEQSVRVNMQIVLENSLTLKVKAVELVDEFTDNEIQPLSPVVKSVLEDQPLIQPFLKIFSATPLDVTVDVENKKLRSESDCIIVIASKLCNRWNVLEEAFSVLTDDGFVLTREPCNFKLPENLGNNFTVFTVHRTSDETLLLLRKAAKPKLSKYIKIEQSEDFGWLPELQNAVCKEKNEDVVLYAESEPKSGIVGLVNCLRREPQTKHVRCVFPMDKAEKFRPQEPFYSNELKKHMAVNIYKNGQWGTYRHLPLEEQKNVDREHCFLNVTARGDLSSLTWMEGPLRHDVKQQSEDDLIYVYYSALNFRDIMTASGKINADVITQNRLEQECVQGCEFSGRDVKGIRYMGMTNCGALSTLLLADIYMKFPIPDDWSLEEAATVPVVYSTVIYGLIMRGQMKRGESILIHSGTGGIGQAAIRLALCYGCRVFTTVGTQEKRDFLKKTFPQLEEANIGNSHDESFDQLVYAKTKGRGVDLVLNSLAEEKLVASVRCLATGGRFIEIGKFDLANNHGLSALLLEKEASFQGVMLDQLFHATPEVKRVLVKLMLDCIEQGVVEPLNRTIFKYDEVEQAFRFMASGKHKGKVLIQIREPEREVLVPPAVTKFPCMPRFCCHPDKVYVILGGLGGFGLELADWLILRGAKKLMLTSRSGVTTGYQKYRLRIWKNYDVVVNISTAPVTTKQGCIQLIEESLAMGRVGGIFNLAVVLADAVFENQTAEDFATSFGPKAYATEYLDELTRKMCPDLSQFVVFSSVSCGRGNPGQTNYGMSNSVMERICEDRKRAGYPALAIEWGAIGEVGLVAEMLEDDTKIEIGGTLQQRISDCLQVMDVFLGQGEAPIVSSMVVAEKRTLNAADNVVDAVINVLGVTDSKSVSFHSTLSELGMDSMTAVEIKQILETEFEVFLSAKDIRTLTLAKLREIQNDKSIQAVPQDKDVANFGIETLFRLTGDKTLSSLPFIELASNAPSNSEAPTLLMIGGIEGFAGVFQDLAKRLYARTIGVQLNLSGTENTIPEMARSVMPIVEKYFPDRQFTLLAYSYGTMIALEVASMLESRGYDGTVICVDGSPLLMKHIMMGFSTGSDGEFETVLLCHMISFFMTSEQTGKCKESIFKCESWEQRLDLVADIIKRHIKEEVDYEMSVGNSIYKRVKAAIAYLPSYGKLRAKVKLLKPTQVAVAGLPADYGLSEYLEHPVDVQTFEGNHTTILENEAVAVAVNSCL